MSHFDFDFEDDFAINDSLMDLMVDQLHQFAEMYECDLSATTSPGSVAQLDRATAF